MDQPPNSSQFESWCARAPWALFGLAPLLLLAGAYFLALLILWSGWNVFLPGAETPFGGIRVHGFANFYFQSGKALYYGAAILIGWGIALVAARQRFKAAWPIVGLVLTALFGATARVRAGRTAVPDGFGHIRMDFTLGTCAQSFCNGMSHALMILSLTVLPYLILRLRKNRFFSA